MQIVGYRAAVEDPAALFVADDGQVESISLEPGDDLSYSLGERRCAGTITDDGHESCSRPSAPYCDFHTDRWPCARCTGDCDRPIDNCYEEHAVYLAAFAPATFKVGVTKSWRLETRLREQGADRAAHLRTVKDGRIARQVEADVATEVGDRVRVPTKLAGLHETVDDAAWKELLAEYTHEATYSFDYGLALTERPQAETLASGEVVGTKGRILVLRMAGTTYGVDMRDLVGYELDDGTPERDLQSSLGAF